MKSFLFYITNSLPEKGCGFPARENWRRYLVDELVEIRAETVGEMSVSHNSGNGTGNLSALRLRSSSCSSQYFDVIPVREGFFCFILTELFEVVIVLPLVKCPCLNLHRLLSTVIDVPLIFCTDV